MIIKLTTISFGIFLAMIISSCQNKSQQALDAKETKEKLLIKQVAQLDEFKLAEKEIDSIQMVSGISLEISISIIDSSFLKEDAGKNISLAFINQASTFENRILYTVKFDKTTQKIISVEKSNEKSKLTNSHSADTVLKNP